MRRLACPIALHPDGAPLRLALAEGQRFPPLVQFDQDAAPITARHLLHSLGLETRSAITIGMSTEVAKACAVHFVLCRVAPPVRPRWKHQQPDGTLITAGWVSFDALAANDVTDWIKATL